MAESMDRLVAGVNVRGVVAQRRARTDPVALASFLDQFRGAGADDLLAAPALPGSVVCRPLPARDACRRYDVSFCSPFNSGYPENDVVRGRLLVRHDDPEPCLCSAAGPFRLGPTMVVLPGWLTKTLVEYEWTVGRPALEAGANVLILEMPFHTRRAPNRTPSGQMAISGDLVMTAGMLRQAVADVGAAMAWLRSLGCRRVGVFGVSMGAWIAGLLASRTDEPDVLIAAATPVRIDRLLTTSPLMTTIQRDVRASELADDHRRAMLEILSPLNFDLRMPRRRVTLIEAQYDVLLPGRGDRILRDHWGGPALFSLAQGHVSLRLSTEFRELFSGIISEQLLGACPITASLRRRAGAALAQVVPA
jgi:pimeloyl-ACP methyl ester carboxylesterase